MRVTLGYDVLNENISVLVNAVKSSVVGDANKTIVFRVSEKDMFMYAFTPTVNIKTKIEDGAFFTENFEKEEYIFQVPLLVFNQFIASFTPTEFSTPLSIGFEPITDYRVKVTVIEKIVEADENEVTNSTSFEATTAPIGATIFNRLEVVERVCEEEEFTQLSELDASWLETQLNDLIPYIPVKAGKASLLSFEEGGLAKTYNDTLLVRFKSGLEYFFGIGGYNSLALTTLQGIVSADKESISYAHEKELGVLVVKSKNTVLGITYDKKPPIARDLIELIEEKSTIEVNRKMLEVYKNRIKAVSGNINATGVSFRVSEALDILEMSGSEVHAHVGITDSEEAEEGVDLAGLEFTVGLGTLESLIFGKEMYSEENDLKFSFTTINGRAFLLVTDSSEVWECLCAL